MPAIKVENFGGMVPREDDRLLPANAAAYSENVRTNRNLLQGFLPAALIRSCTNPNTLNVYRIPNDPIEKASVSFSNSTWMEFSTTFVNVLRTPVTADSYRRYYWAREDGVPKYNTLTRIQNGQSEYTLGVPQPTVAPGVTPSGGSSEITTSRAYVYTWVTEYGEEGPPSSPTLATGKQDDDWAITVTAPSGGQSSGRNITHVRIYRTVTSSAGVATYYYVTQMSIGTTSYNDELSDTTVAGQSQLESIGWTEPPALKGWVAMPNGIFAGWVDNTVYFSEPYRPHAWPTAYALTVDYPIVGLGVFGQSLVVATTGNPVIISGVNPATMTQFKVDAVEPCVSRGSIISAPEGVYYASLNGVMFVNSGGIQNITDPSIDRKQWLGDIDPYLLIAVRYGENYMAQHAPRAGSGTGVLIEKGKGAFGWLSSGLAIKNLQADPWTGEIFYIYDNKVYRLDPTGASGMDTYKWRSKVFHDMDHSNMSVAVVDFDVPSGTATQAVSPTNTLEQTLASDQYGLLRVYADGRHVATREIRTSGEPIRLPSGYLADEWQFEIEARVSVRRVVIASTMVELSRV